MTKTASRGEFHCAFNVRRWLIEEPEVFARMWSLLGAPEVGAATDDRAETGHRYRFTPDPAEAFELFDEYEAITVRGARDGFLFDVRTRTSGVYRTYAWIDEESVEGASWLPWIMRLIDALPVLFGGACTMTEYDAKHTYVKEHPSGGRSVGALGVSNAEFQQFLPGIYWLTVFGPELAAALDFSGLAQLPVTVTTLSHGARTVQIDEPVIATDMAKRLELEARIADALGAQYFFDRNRKDIEFTHPPAFKAVLDEVAGRK